MKVLHVAPTLALRYGGVSANVRRLCEALAEAGIGTEVWAGRWGVDPATDGPADRALEKAGAAVRHFPLAPGPLGERYGWSPAMTKALREKIGHFDLVHIHTIWRHSSRAAARACRRAGIPYVVSPCGMLAPYGFRVRLLQKWLYGAWAVRPLLAGAEALVWTSRQERRSAVRFGVSRPDAVIPRFLKPNEVPALPRGAFKRKVLGPDSNRTHLILFLGRLDPKKRLDLATEAFTRLARRRDDVHLIVAGADESGQRARSEKILRRAGFSNRAAFVGFLAGEEKWAAFRDASLFILPSEDENFGVAALEAMAAGVPTLLSGGVALAEEAEQAGAARRIPLRPDDWAQGMERLLNDPAARGRMSEAARRWTAAAFVPSRTSADTQALYRRILEGHRPRAGSSARSRCLG